MFNDKEFDREIDCLKAHLWIFAYELERSDKVLEYIQNNDNYKFSIDKPDKGYTIRLHLTADDINNNPALKNGLDLAVKEIIRDEE